MVVGLLVLLTDDDDFLHIIHLKHNLEKVSGQEGGKGREREEEGGMEGDGQKEEKNNYNLRM